MKKSCLDKSSWTDPQPTSLQENLLFKPPAKGRGKNTHHDVYLQFSIQMLQPPLKQVFPVVLMLQGLCCPGDDLAMLFPDLLKDAAWVTTTYQAETVTVSCYSHHDWPGWNRDSIMLQSPRLTRLKQRQYHVTVTTTDQAETETASCYSHHDWPGWNRQYHVTVTTMDQAETETASCYSHHDWPGWNRDSIMLQSLWQTRLKQRQYHVTITMTDQAEIEIVSILCHSHLDWLGWNRQHHVTFTTTDQAETETVSYHSHNCHQSTYNTIQYKIQLYCLCVEKFAFWLIIYIKHSVHFTIKHQQFNRTQELNKRSNTKAKTLNNNNVHTYT